jgi:hypothetical protein
MTELRNDFHNTVYRSSSKSPGDKLSPATVREIKRALCGVRDCVCSGPDGVRDPRWGAPGITVHSDGSGTLRAGGDI